MFSGRKPTTGASASGAPYATSTVGAPPVEPGPKRLPQHRGVLNEITPPKRQRLEWGTNRHAKSALRYPQGATGATSGPLEDIEDNNVLLETPEGALARLRALPPLITDALRRQRPAPDRVTACRVAVPTTPGGDERVVVSYYVLALRQRLVLWNDGTGAIVTLPLPEDLTLDSDARLHPFLFALYGARVSLMIVSSSGIVLFWEDIELPYESVPLRVQIPLQPGERVETHSGQPSLAVPTNATTTPQDGQGLLCWSNQGNVWEVAMEDRRIRVRSLERGAQGGFLSGLTKTVSQFFFASGSGPELPTDAPVQCVKLIPPTRDQQEDGTVAMLVLYATGTVEQRTLSTLETMDGATSTMWHFDANRVAISYFSEAFPGHHLAKVFMISVPFVTAESFGLLVAYVSTAHDDHTSKVKYALFQFKFPTTQRRIPDPDWACLLDYEPVFSEMSNSADYFEVECLQITSSALYLVWPKTQPIHFTSIQLPGEGQTSVRSQGFSLQGVAPLTAFGFGSRIESSTIATDAIKGSVSFLIVDYDESSNGIVCSATASTMACLERPREDQSEDGTIRRRMEAVSELAPESHVLGSNLSAQEYARHLTIHFQNYNLASGPLRVGSKDVRAVAQGAVAVVFQMLDAKASSGLRWGKDATEQTALSGSPRGTSLVTPKLVRYQLEEKRAHFEEFLGFLQHKCGEVWQHIEASQELMQYIVDAEEKLHAAISLSKFQGSLMTNSSDDSPLQPKLTGQLLLRAIERTVEQRGYQKDQLRLAGYNAFDIFYCEVSKVGEVFSALAAEVQCVASNVGEGNTEYLYGLLESGYSMQSLLKVPTSTLLEANARWMFTRQIREVIAGHLSRLSSVLGYSSTQSSKQAPWMPEEVIEASEQIHRLGGLLMDVYSRFIPISNGEATEDLRKEANITKRLILNALVYVATDYHPHRFSPVSEDEVGWSTQKHSELFVTSVRLAEKYAYYDAMVYLAYKEDEENLCRLDYVLGRLPKSRASKRLESYCRQHPDFSDFVYRWYGGEARYPWLFDVEGARAKMFTFLFSNSPTFGPSLHTYVKSHPDLSKQSWVTATACEKFDHVAALALNEARAETSSLSKRKTLTSIAKLATLAASSTTPRAQNVVLETARELKTLKIQEVLQELPLDLSVENQPMSPDQLVLVALDASSRISRDDPLRVGVFLLAVEALECFPFETSPSDFESACVRVWRHCALADEETWALVLHENDSGINEHRAEELMRGTVLFQSMVRYITRWKNHPVHRSAGLTVDIIDDMVQREGDSNSLISVRSRQVFVKALNLARVEV